MMIEVEKLIRGEEVLILPPQKVIESQRYDDKRRQGGNLHVAGANRDPRHIEVVVDAPFVNATRTSRLSKLRQGSLHEDTSQLSSAFIVGAPRATTRFSATTTNAPTTAVESATAMAVQS